MTHISELFPKSQHPKWFSWLKLGRQASTNHWRLLAFKLSPVFLSALTRRAPAAATNPNGAAQASNARTYRIISYECARLTWFFRTRYGTCVVFPWVRAEELAKATVDAWKVKYEGTAKNIFLHCLAGWNSERKDQSTSVPDQAEESVEAAYINVITILQSSGTGKSRLLYETAADVFTIPINLRTGTREYRSIWLSPQLRADHATCARWLSSKRRGGCAILSKSVQGFQYRQVGFLAIPGETLL